MYNNKNFQVVYKSFIELSLTNEWQPLQTKIIYNYTSYDKALKIAKDRTKIPSFPQSWGAYQYMGVNNNTYGYYVINKLIINQHNKLVEIKPIRKIYNYCDYIVFKCFSQYTAEILENGIDFYIKYADLKDEYEDFKNGGVYGTYDNETFNKLYEESYNDCLDQLKQTNMLHYLNIEKDTCILPIRIHFDLEKDKNNLPEL